MKRKPESEILEEILATCGSLPHVRLFRNNVGVATTANGYTIRYGLMPGSADLIGWRTIEVTPDMVGTKIAQFLSVEVMSSIGKPSAAQKNWHARVNEAGGFAVISRGDEYLLGQL